MQGADLFDSREIWVVAAGSRRRLSSNLHGASRASARIARATRAAEVADAGGTPRKLPVEAAKPAHREPRCGDGFTGARNARNRRQSLSADAGRTDVARSHGRADATMPPARGIAVL